VTADALGGVRLVAAALLPWALARAPVWWAAPALFVIAASTDYLDGIVARRGRGPTAHGAVLDNVADVAFVVAGTATGAWLGIVPAAVPGAIVLAVIAYAVASARRGEPARSAVGHAAGVLNYAITGVVAGAVALPGRGWHPILAVASAVVVAVNVAAVVLRAAGNVSRARVPHAAGSRSR
jgi:phosphatidylglycerophosphate synthase